MRTLSTWDALQRIIEQARKAQDNIPIHDVYPGLYGITLRELRLGNIIAIATVAMEQERE